MRTAKPNCFAVFSYYQVSQNFWLAFFYGRIMMAVAGRTRRF